MKKLIFYIILIIIFSQFSLAATIHGTVYDLSLDPVKNIIVELDTNPAQRLVSKSGIYSFEVPLGTYTISAKQNLNSEELTQEEIIVKSQQGEYVVDLFIFPEFEEKPQEISYLPYILLLVIIIIIIIIYKKYKKKPKTEEIQEPSDQDLDKIIKIIKNNNNRITQKELRKHFPLSEAKISLLIADLEKQGKLEKIKKGRGNILILK